MNENLNAAAALAQQRAAAPETTKYNEKEIDAAREHMRKMLYEHPLYEAIQWNKDGRTEIRVLVLGSGVYAQKFIDLCLGAAQMKGCSLRIDALSDAPDADRNRYLEARPALKRFVSVGGDGSIAEDDERSYGALRFRAFPEVRDEQRGTQISAFCSGEENSYANQALAFAVLCNAEDGDLEEIDCDYVFISLGDGALNRDAAAAMAEFISEREHSVRPPVCYVSTGEETERVPAKGIYPVPVNQKLTAENVDPDLERWAFNGHLTWLGPNIDVNESLRQFRLDGYSYNSSVAYALSIKPKLASVGIILKSDLQIPEDAAREAGFTVAKDMAEAAKFFNAQVLANREADPEARAKFNALVALEHRRWVLHLVTDGWDTPQDANGNLDLRRCIELGAVRAKEEKLHPCIVFCGEDEPLASEAFCRDNQAKWDDYPVQANPEQLDELDLVSVALHQCFRAHAEKLKAQNPLQSADMQELANVVAHAARSEDAEVVRAYKQFRFCLKNILKGVESYSRQYSRYARGLEAALEAVLEDGELMNAKARLANIRHTFFPIVESNLRRDYKQLDHALIERLSFIITYRYKPSLALAFEDGANQHGRNQAVFASIASATVLCPEHIHYLYCADRNSDLQLFVSKIRAVLNYLSERTVETHVHFAIACDLPESSTKALKKELDRIRESSGSRCASLAEFALIESQGAEDAADKLLAYLQAQAIDLYDGSTPLFPSTIDSGTFARRVTEAEISYFEFDWMRKEFHHLFGCAYLSYFRDDTSYIKVDDTFALMNARNVEYDAVPSFQNEYEQLWEIYTGGSGVSDQSFERNVLNWNLMCDKLSEHEEKRRKPLAAFAMTAGAKKTIRDSCPFPPSARQAVEYLRIKLADCGVVEAEASIDERGLSIVAELAHAMQIKSLIANPDLPADPGRIHVWKRATYDGEEVVVYCDEMTIKDAPLDYRRHAPILQKLADGGFICNLNWNDAGASFDCASPQVKKLLTTAGEILEIYTYYMVLATGFYDDVLSGYQFTWEDGVTKNELDLVLTKGFRSVIVECKAVSRMHLNYYHKLHSVADTFGIGTVKVLVGNTYSRNNFNVATNKMERMRGKQLGIITISGRKQLENIGEALSSLIR